MKIEYLSLYKNGIEIDMPTDIHNREKYLFQLISGFKDINMASPYSVGISKKSPPWEMICIVEYPNTVKNNIFKYLVYSVIKLDD